MKKSLLISIVAILIGGFFASSVVADDKRQHDTLVKFKGGIGAIPISNVALDAAGRCYYHPKHGPRGQFSRSDLEDRRSQGQGGG